DFAGAGLQGHDVAAALAQQALGVGLQVSVEAQVQILPGLVNSIGGPAAVHPAVAIGARVVRAPVAGQQGIVVALYAGVAQAIVAAAGQLLGQVQKRRGIGRPVAQHRRGGLREVGTLAAAAHRQARPLAGVVAQAGGLGLREG
nr:hypothetical protein [Tanacetum cinerariifolium]